MQSEKARRNEACCLLSAGQLDGSISPSSSSSSPTSCSQTSGAKYIEHHVSKMDTLAGLAIKYGVEVADIKRMNGLATDGQMFAHKTLRIPWPGRHPPCSIHLNGAANYRGETLGGSPCRDTLDSLQSPKLIPPQHKISPAMINLQGYYGLNTPKGGLAVKETEMSVYKISSSLCFEDESPKTSPASDPEYPNQPRMSASQANGFPWENGEVVEIPVVAEAGDGSDEKLESEKSIRRRQKADTDPPLHTLDIPIEDGGGLAGRIGKSAGPRLKLGASVDSDFVRQHAVSTDDASTGNGLTAVRKSTSTSSLQESDSCSTRSSSKWTLKSDAISRPVFGGLPKPMVAWNKAALD